MTSVGETTTDLCVWSLERNGFDVTVLRNGTTLANKLKRIYQTKEDFLRVDADIIVNKNMTPDLLEELILADDIWWWQFQTFDWYKQDINHSLSFVRSLALPYLQEVIDRFQNDLRPETECSRVEAFYNPRRFETYDQKIMGVHGYGIKDFEHVVRLKAARGQSHQYDFELAERLNGLSG